MHALKKITFFFYVDMPKSRSRVRRRAAPTDLREPEVTNSNIDDITNSSSTTLPQLQSPVARSRRRRTNNVISTQNTQMNIPSADEIAASLFTQLQGSGFQLTRTVPTNNQSSDDLQQNLANSATNIINNNTQNRHDFLQALQTDNNMPSDVITEATHHQQTITQEQLPVTFLPPLSSDPNLQSSSVSPLTNSFNSCANPGTISVNSLNSPLGLDVPILKNSLPLGYHVNDKCKNLIWSDNYINFGNLLPQFIDEDDCNDVLFENSNFTISKKQNSKKEIVNIHQWSNAFDIFLSLYIQKFPNLVLSLIKYGYNIRAMSKQFGFQAVKVYDEHFRQVRKMMNFDWGQINDELWRTAAFSVNANRPFPNSKSQPSTGARQYKSVGSPFQRRAQQFPGGYCWAFCRTGVCSNEKTCQLKHSCVSCGKRHSTLTCRAGEKGNATNNKLPANTSSGKKA